MRFAATSFLIVTLVLQVIGLLGALSVSNSYDSDMVFIALIVYAVFIVWNIVALVPKTPEEHRRAAE